MSDPTDADIERVARAMREPVLAKTYCDDCLAYPGEEHTLGCENSINARARAAIAAMPQAARIAALEEALHRISLGSQNSGTTKESLGREARRALVSER